MVELSIVLCIGLQEKVGMMRGVQLDWIMYVLNSVFLSIFDIKHDFEWVFFYWWIMTNGYKYDIFIVSYPWT